MRIGRGVQAAFSIIYISATQPCPIQRSDTALPPIKCATVVLRGLLSCRPGDLRFPYRALEVMRANLCAAFTPFVCGSANFLAIASYFLLGCLCNPFSFFSSVAAAKVGKVAKWLSKTS